MNNRSFVVFGLKLVLLSMWSLLTNPVVAYSALDVFCNCFFETYLTALMFSSGGEICAFTIATSVSGVPYSDAFR